MYTVDDVKRVKDSVSLGSYVLDVDTDYRINRCRAGKVVLKSKHVFVTEALGAVLPGVRVSYRYADLLAGGSVEFVPEEVARSIADASRRDREFLPAPV